MVAINKIGVFPCAGKVSAKTVSLLQAYRQFTFPGHHFNGLNTNGTITAMAIDCLKKTPTVVVLAIGQVGGRNLEFLIAANSPHKPIREMIISEFNGQQNVVAQVKGLEIVDASPITKVAPAYSQPIIQKEGPLQPTEYPFTTPDYSFQPTELPRGRCGSLSQIEINYFEYLSGEITRHWHFSGFSLPDIESGTTIPLAAEALVRSNEAKLSRLVAWGMLLPSDADQLLIRSREVGAERLTLMLMKTVEEYLTAKFSPKQIPTMVKRLMPAGYIDYLFNKYQAQGVPRSDAWRFAVSNPADPEAALKKALKAATDLVNKYQAEGVPRSDAWRFAVSNPADPEAALKKALKVATELANKYQDQGVTPSDARYFAVYNPNKPETALTKALKVAADLANKFQDQGVTLSDAWYFAVEYKDAEAALKKALKVAADLANKYQDQGVTPSDAWHFAGGYKDTEAALKKALKVAADLAAKYQDQGVTPSDAWRFAVNNPADPAAALRKSKGL